jgi:hypothetical protein
VDEACEEPEGKGRKVEEGRRKEGRKGGWGRKVEEGIRRKVRKVQERREGK